MQKQHVPLALPGIVQQEIEDGDGILAVVGEIGAQQRRVADSHVNVQQTMLVQYHGGRCGDGDLDKRGKKERGRRCFYGCYYVRFSESSEIKSRGFWWRCGLIDLILIQSTPLPPWSS